LDELTAAATELENASDPVPPPVVEQVTSAVRRHIDVEEATVLDQLDNTVSVERLRLLGETFKRGRDAALKARGERAGKYSRPRVSRAELYERARYRGIAGRSAMSRSELLSALKESE
jgi:hemerythrin-like domain-containing protein